MTDSQSSELDRLMRLADMLDSGQAESAREALRRALFEVLRQREEYRERLSGCSRARDDWQWLAEHPLAWCDNFAAGLKGYPPPSEALVSLRARAVAAESRVERAERELAEQLAPVRLDELEFAGDAVTAWRAYHAMKGQRERAEQERATLMAKVADYKRLRGEAMADDGRDSTEKWRRCEVAREALFALVGERSSASAK